jgi:pimeloyl-ACP methyl ester carboxylesterase
MNQPPTGFSAIVRRISLLAVLIGALVLMWPAAAFADSAAAAAAPPPERGKVLSVRPMQLSSTLANVAIGKRITYSSRDSSNRAITVSGAVLTPKPSILIAHPSGANKILAWAHGTAGLADKCAPSGQPNLYPDSTYNEYAEAVASYLMQGWTVTATDYAGLGTPGVHPYLVGDSEGRAVIDSVRAARNLNPLLSNAWAVSGHSQGGQAALFAGEIADSYGAGLLLKGVVAIAPASNLELIAPEIPNTPGRGYLAFAVFGLAAVDPTVRPRDILTPRALSLASVVLETGCFNEVLAAYAPFTAAQMVVNNGQVPQSFLDKLARSNPAQEANNAPVFLVQGDIDTTIPLAITEILLAQECEANTVPTKLTVYPGQEHDPVLDASRADVVAYLTARFNNQSAPTSCT